ncbi:plasmid mobilization relaxosome protein MobC [Roseovarius nanhaiticus]|uniref:plasmid mobilization relaxosome protein MobC n=1 Tax=Roseovarius nanhaiticus TaxID=573024 RepID=UPI002491F145|nr:plasmid mobilization relaxosome protein MobC [Roseovarius nanhaiticus]
MARAHDGKRRSSKRRATRQIFKRVTPEVLADFIERADAAGYSDHQAYLTAFITGEIEPDRAARKVAVQGLGHIGKIGSNLNQLTRAVNAGRLTILGPKEDNIVEAAWIAVEQIGESVLKALQK